MVEGAVMHSAKILKDSIALSERGILLQERRELRGLLETSADTLLSGSLNARKSLSVDIRRALGGGE